MLCSTILFATNSAGNLVLILILQVAKLLAPRTLCISRGLNACFCSAAYALYIQGEANCSPSFLFCFKSNKDRSCSFLLSFLLSRYLARSSSTREASIIGLYLYFYSRQLQRCRDSIDYNLKLRLNRQCLFKRGNILLNRKVRQKVVCLILCSYSYNYITLVALVYRDNNREMQAAFLLESRVNPVF